MVVRGGAGAARAAGAAVLRAAPLSILALSLVESAIQTFGVPPSVIALSGQPFSSTPP